MSSSDTLRSLDSTPDHGFGPLGRLAHGVLTEYAGRSLSVPRLHIGQNVLPDPPFPLTSHIPMPLPQAAWLQTGQDLTRFLTSVAASIRSQPVPPASAFSTQQRTMQRMLRIDAIALAWATRTVHPTAGVAEWILTADILSGQATPQDLDPAVATPTHTVWVVDLTGAALLACAAAEDATDRSGEGATEPEIQSLPADDPAAALLHDVLDAQHAWTTAAFGLDRPPAR